MDGAGHIDARRISDCRQGAFERAVDRAADGSRPEVCWNRDSVALTRPERTAGIPRAVAPPC